MVKHGTFAVPKGTAGPALERAATEAVRKFTTKLMKEGWRIQQRPTIQKVVVNASDTFRAVEDKGKKFQLWIPESTQMRPDHPWYKPDEDQYEVAVRCTRPPQKATFDLPDWFIQKHGAFAGLTVKE